MAAAEQEEPAGNEQYQRRHMDAIFEEGFSFSGFERDLLAWSLEGRRFLDISGVSGVDSISDGRGAAFADFDNDGDLDIFLVALQGNAHHLFRNNVGSENGFLRVTLEGTWSGRDAFGAEVRVKTRHGTLTKVKAGGSGFLSQNDPRLLFGLGDDPEAEWVEVTWPGGTAQRWERVAAGTSLRLREGSDARERIAEHRFRLPDPFTEREELLARLNVRIGERFPDLDLKTLQGDPIPLHDVVRPGSRYFVNLWATYCVPCRKEMPELQRLQPRFQAAGIRLVGVSLDFDTVQQVPAFLDRFGIRYPIYTTGESTMGRIFAGEEALVPLSFLLDGEGRVVQVLSGWSEASQRAIRELLGEDPTADLPAPAGLSP